MQKNLLASQSVGSDPRNMIRTVKKVVRPVVPDSVVRRLAPNRGQDLQFLEAKRRDKFETLRPRVVATIESIKSLTDEQCRDVRFLEEIFIPTLGLNDEALEEQPSTLGPYFGQGLHLWQYPRQLAPYLAWLADNAAGITSYLEIGCRWGGMFILVTEWLRRNGAELRSLAAIDPIAPTPFIDEYFDYISRTSSGTNRIDANYYRHFSTDPVIHPAVEAIKPDMVFIDGDHGLRGAMADHMMVRRYAKIIVHHDIWSMACPDTTFLWSVVKELESDKFDMREFIQQYDEVQGHFLGIGVMKRKT